MLTQIILSLTVAVAPAAGSPTPSADVPKAPTSKHQAPSACRDKVARMLWKAGFRGRANHIAWSITWRESHHRNLDESSPWYTGALGMWQIQTSAHSGKPWWSRSAMLDPLTQSRIVYRHMTNRGRTWTPWGLNPRGDAMDASQYAGWSSSQRSSWIWAPYIKAWNLYPQGCRSS
jgi:hypothetical protein